MPKRRGLSKGLFVIAVWAIGAVALTFVIVQAHSYAATLNDAGSVRGGTQRVVKMELAGQSVHETEQRVSELLANLTQQEESRLYKSPETANFIEKLEAVKQQWDLILDEIDRIDRGEGSTGLLLELSETHFAMADDMVLAAQTRSEDDFLWMGIVCSVLLLSAATIMAFLRNDQMNKLRTAYFTDPLTKRKNLPAFEEGAASMIAGRPQGSYAVAYTNISNFRSINDSYGYEAGNQLIRTLARLLDSACKRDELAGHANADHFFLLLRNEPLRVERLRDQMEAKLRSVPDLHFTGSLSLGCGVCEVDRPETGIQHYMSNAIAVAKRGAADTGVAHYDEAFRQDVNRRNRIDQHMEQALANREFLLYLQPKFSLADGSLAGAEALVRWESPDLGFLPPDSFIPVFEQNGFIVQLDFFMLEQVCRALPLAQKGNEASLVVSVNFSRITIMREGFVERLVEIVDAAGLPRELIEIEVTESAFVVDEDAVIDKLETLKEQGFRLSMDDFGTGYSSLNLLCKLPIDVLKIDRSFLSEHGTSDRARSVLKGVIDMTRDLGLVTVCEGVETSEQAQLLHDLGCAIGQGYVFSKPLPLDEFRTRFGIAGGSEK